MKRGILVASLEMPASQVFDRLVSIMSGVPLRRLAEGIRTEFDMQRVASAATTLANCPLTIRDDLHDLHEIVACARALAKSKEGLGVILVDYIQLVRVQMSKDSSREREVAEVSRALRLLGLELGCLVMGITQLNEQGKARESRAIGQDATSVLIVRLTENAGEERVISVPIQRNGPCGVECRMRYSGGTTSFSELE